MNNLLSAAAALFALALVALIISFATDGATHSYTVLLFYVGLAAGGLLTLFYFLVSRKGKDRSV